MSNTRQAKACPRCGTMTLLDSKACAICGHEFRTNTDEPRPAFDFNRTQQMTLPLPTTRPEHERVTSVEEDFSFAEPEPPQERLNAPAILMAVIIALLLFALVWWFVRQM